MFSEIISEVVFMGGVSGGIVSGLIIWLTKTWISTRLEESIKHEYNQEQAKYETQLNAKIDTEIATHKANLETQMNTEIERLKSSLQIEATKKHVMFSKLHEKRAEVLEKIHTLLVRSYSALYNYTKQLTYSTDKPIKERGKEAAKTSNELRQYFIEKRIYIPQTISDKIERFYKDTSFTGEDFAYLINDNDIENHAQKWGKISKKVQTDILELLKDIEEEFRKLLGDEDKYNAKTVSHES